jgi:antitoxin (DNA-binding transcriptional repressor) of toxin-antitoxin stability system
MLAVGIRELKAKLGEYVQRARRGEIVLVTDRGAVVAELRSPISVSGLPPDLVGLLPLVERGEVVLGLSSNGPGYAESSLRMPAGTAQRLLDEERTER